MTGTYNMLEQPWIPVRTRAGERCWIRPSEVAGRADPPSYIDSGRPDFDGSLTQFLIGLLQTCATPKDRSAWENWMRSPPDVDELDELFMPVRHAFFLDGDGPRFMQDLELNENDEHALGVAALLIESPGAKTVRDNGDFFNKRDRVAAMGAPAVAAALFTLQTNAPSGGAGHRTSLRGGGPLSTLPVGDDLWETCWLSVLTATGYADVPGDIELKAPEATFPWLARTRTSEKGHGIYPEETHPAQHYWAMPRRIRLELRIESGTCGVFGNQSELICNHYVTKNYGCNYLGAWMHPLTPHATIKSGEPPNPRKGQPTGLSYRDWPALLARTEDRWRARVVDAYFNDARWQVSRTDRLWVFGYDMDNMKARCWYSATTPILVSRLDEQARQRATKLAEQLVAASDLVRATLIKQIKAALLRRPGDRRGDLSVISRTFWEATEPSFFGSLQRLCEVSEQEGIQREVGEGWLEKLHLVAKELFDRHSQSNARFDSLDVKRVAIARNELVKFTSPRGNKLRGLVDLPRLPKSKAKSSEKEIAHHG